MKYVSKYLDEKNESVSYEQVLKAIEDYAFIGSSYYFDPKTKYKTKAVDVNYVECSTNPNYIISYNRRGEVVGILRKESLLKRNDSRLKNGRNYCKSVEAQINKLLMPPESDAKVKGKLKIIVQYLQSLIND
jgi:hypothetical protein